MNNKNLLKLYDKLHLIRTSQQTLINEYHPENKMRCPIHFCLGQEALAACVSFFIKKNDFILSHHRSHGYYLAKNCSLDAMVAEFYGKKNGSNSGLAGSQELSSVKNNFFSGTILSGMFAIALGTALFQKIQKKKDITVTVIGDGGMEEGICYEALNIASLKSLPILFICENNNYSIHTYIKTRSISKNYEKKVKSFDIEYIKISDYKPENIIKKVENIISNIRRKSKPIFLEFDTMRTCGHVGPEDDDKEFSYRDNDLKKWRGKDSVSWIKNKLLKKKMNNLVNKIETKNNKKLDNALKKARQESFLRYEKSLKLNFIKSYSKIIKKFSKPQKMFKHKQKLLIPKPY